jgi:hypothetical protein
LSQLQRWGKSHDSSPYNRTVHICSFITPRLLCRTSFPYPAVRPTSRLNYCLMSCSLAYASWLCALCSYMDSKHHHHESSHPSGALCLFMNHCAETNQHVPLLILGSPINHCISWTDTPHSLGAHPLPCALPCADRRDSSWCVDGVIQSLQCTHVAKGTQVHSLGVCSSCPCPYPNTSQVSIICHKGSRACFPLGSQCHHYAPKMLLPMHHKTSTCPIDHILLVLSAQLVFESAQGVCELDGCRRRPYRFLNQPPIEFGAI